MAYTAWSVVFGEQPTAAKWNQLGANDAGFKDGTNIDANAITNTQLAAGVHVQAVETDYASLAAQTSLIPYDNTIPQITEGFEVMTQTITPKSATNVLLIDVNIYGSASALGEFIAALFRDSTANAIAADSVTVSSAGFLVNLKLTAKVTAGSTSATTFRVRIGSAGNVNTAFNGFTNSGTSGSATQAFGAAVKSSIKITEIKA